MSSPRDSDPGWRSVPHFVAEDREQRRERIDEIRCALAEGRYEIDAMLVAGAMLEFYSRNPEGAG